MKLVTRVKLSGTLLAGVLLTLASVAANAAGTTAGTTISNQATVNYSVGGVSQSAIGSSPAGNTSGAGSATTFVVDDKLVLTVTKQDASLVSVTPGQTTAILVFKVTNAGNATQGVTFSDVQEATGTADPFGGATTDDFNATSPSVYVSSSNSATYNSGSDTASSIPQLAAGSFAYVFVVASIPNTRVNGDMAVNGLIAQVAAAGASATYGSSPGSNITTDDSAAAWTPGTQQNIFADAAGTDDSALDGKASDRDAWLVSSASLTNTKSVTVVSDPTGAATPHAIPGAVMKYTVTVVNAASATANASGVSIADDLSSQIPTNLGWNTGTLTVTTPGVNSGSAFTCADSGATATSQAATGSGYTAVTCDYNITTATSVTVSGVTLKPGDTATIVYMVLIQ